MVTTAGYDRGDTVRRRALSRRRTTFAWTWAVALVLGSWSVSSGNEGSSPAVTPEHAGLEEKWGIRVEGIRLSAAGNIMDFRYRIVDADKALALVDRRLTPYVVDKTSGAKFTVPSSAKVGPMRQTTKYGKPKQGRTYFVLFSNPGKFVKRGSQVSVVIGDFEADGLVVQ